MNYASVADLNNEVVKKDETTVIIKAIARAFSFWELTNQEAVFKRKQQRAFICVMPI